MAEPLHLTSAENPRVKLVVKLREARQRRKTGLFIAEGSREIARALAAGLMLREAFWCPGLLGDDPRGKFAGAEAAAWFTVTGPLMKKMSILENPEGVLAVFESPRVALADVRQRIADAVEPPLVLVAVGTTKPGNLGAMLRSAEAAGATAVLVSDGLVDLFNPNAIRASTGAVFTLPVVAASGEEVRKFLRDLNITILAADPAATMRYDKMDLAGAVALVIGAEDTGLDDAWRKGSDVLLSIPTRGRVVDSLNAATAAAVLLFEAVRQRTKD